MICETCHGQGLVQPGMTAASRNPGGPLPCEECGGTGYDHCCDPKAYPDMACQLRGAQDNAAAGERDAPDTGI